MTEKNHEVSTAAQPKTSLDLKLCFIKISSRKTLLEGL